MYPSMPVPISYLPTCLGVASRSAGTNDCLCILISVVQAELTYHNVNVPFTSAANSSWDARRHDGGAACEVCLVV